MILQATTYVLYGAMVKTPATDGRPWPLYTALVYNSDGSVLDRRSMWNDFELVRWLDSFGFNLSSYMDTILSAGDW